MSSLQRKQEKIKEEIEGRAVRDVDELYNLENQQRLTDEQIKEKEQKLKLRVTELKKNSLFNLSEVEFSSI